MNKSYNYIIIGGSGFYKIAYSNLFLDSNIQYFENYVDGLHNPFFRLLTKLNFNLAVNNWIKTPFKKFVFPKIFPYNFKDSAPLCFVFFGVQFSVINTSYIEYLRRIHPAAKFVLYMQDIVSSLPYYDIESYKKRFDLILSYDKNDCLKYGLTYFPTPYSFVAPSTLKKQAPIDVFFCGAAKTRLKTILDIYIKCKQKGLSCKFFITGVPEADRLVADDIVYDHKISYIENLSYVNASKCIVEVMQENAVGFTPRLWEALFYGKHLLTNNEFADIECYNSNSIHNITEIEQITSWISQDISIDLSVQKKKDPHALLALIETKI